MTMNQNTEIAQSSIMAEDRIVSMAKQIGDFFAPYPPERRTEGVRNHLRTYWDPRMREALFELIDAGSSELPQHIIEAATFLRQDKNGKPGYYGPPKA